MRYSFTFTSTGIFRFVLLLIAILFSGGLLAIYLSAVINYEVALGFIPMFNLDGEFNLPAIFTVGLIATNALLLFLVSRHTSLENNNKKYWRILGYIFLYLSFDELTGTHERVGGVVYRLAPNAFSASESRYWMLPVGILLLLFALYFFRFYLRLPKLTRINFTVAGVVYIAGAMGVEYLGDLYVANAIAGTATVFTGDFFYSLISSIEEVFEMVGMALFLRALLLHLQALSNSRYFHLTFSIGNIEKSSLLAPGAKQETSVHK